eukprot:PhM_4_TR18719/c2_g1_i1/m.62131
MNTEQAEEDRAQIPTVLSACSSGGEGNTTNNNINNNNNKDATPRESSNGGHPTTTTAAGQPPPVEHDDRAVVVVPLIQMAEPHTDSTNNEDKNSNANAALSSRKSSARRSITETPRFGAAVVSSDKPPPRTSRHGHGSGTYATSAEAAATAAASRSIAGGGTLWHDIPLLKMLFFVMGCVGVVIMFEDRDGDIRALCICAGVASCVEFLYRRNRSRARQRVVPSARMEAMLYERSFTHRFITMALQAAPLVLLTSAGLLAQASAVVWLVVAMGLPSHAVVQMVLLLIHCFFPSNFEESSERKGLILCMGFQVYVLAGIVLPHLGLCVTDSGMPNVFNVISGWTDQQQGAPSLADTILNMYGENGGALSPPPVKVTEVTITRMSEDERDVAWAMAIAGVRKCVAELIGIVEVELGLVRKSYDDDVRVPRAAPPSEYAKASCGLITRIENYFAAITYLSSSSAPASDGAANLISSNAARPGAVVSIAVSIENVLLHAVRLLGPLEASLRVTTFSRSSWMHVDPRLLPVKIVTADSCALHLMFEQLILCGHLRHLSVHLSPDGLSHLNIKALFYPPSSTGAGDTSNTTQDLFEQLLLPSEMCRASMSRVSAGSGLTIAIPIAVVRQHQSTDPVQRQPGMCGNVWYVHDADFHKLPEVLSDLREYAEAVGTKVVAVPDAAGRGNSTSPQKSVFIIPSTGIVFVPSTSTRGTPMVSGTSVPPPVILLEMGIAGCSAASVVDTPSFVLRWPVLPSCIFEAVGAYDTEGADGMLALPPPPSPPHTVTCPPTSVLLLVYDHDAMRATLAQRLSRLLLSSAVEAVHSWSDAIAFVKQMTARDDVGAARRLTVVFQLDDMPVMDGGQFARLLREYEAGNGRPRSWLVGLTTCLDPAATYSPRVFRDVDVILPDPAPWHQLAFAVKQRRR